MTSRQSNGSGPPTNVTVVVGEEKTTTPSNNSRNEIWTIVTREARAVSAWAVLAPLMRLLFAPLVARACVGSHETCPSSNIFSVVAGWILCFFPKSVAQDMAPGFMFASAWCVPFLGMSHGSLFGRFLRMLTPHSYHSCIHQSGSCLLFVIALESYRMCHFEYVR